jgi:N-acyl-D-aspartate/D-glutamate deacylase
MFSIAQLSYWSAKHLGDMGLEAMQERGRIQAGMVADITIFDPDKVMDKATYKAGEQGLPTAGIPYVIVSGKQVVKNGQFQEVWAGQPIRFPAEEKGRFVPVNIEKWVKDFSINTTSVDDSPVNPKNATATNDGIQSGH